ncbi:hypothetical protein M404DRAFT_999763 [Pisolithus tinctorius Marx 270]|uniref:Uncharacterized protein n=1 Tax=Pisolithus tinctorius Marx 270 TaxID=870435 RepID=A0A0C3PCZ5_PISTI|nr:hypothetical protein M404DRAFT_999763 [Pisolithus tinctorius Marx 270]
MTGSRSKPRTDLLRLQPSVVSTTIVEHSNSIVTPSQCGTQAPFPKCITIEILSFTLWVTPTDSHGSGGPSGIKFA